MKESQSTAGATPAKSFGQKKYLTLFAWVAAICLSFGAYTLLVNALVRDAADPAHGPSQPLTAPNLAAVMKIDPVTTYADPGATFVVTVTIENAVDLGAFEFELTYDATRLNATGVVSGTFLGSTGRTVAELGPIFDTGSVTYGAFSFGADPGPNGDGALALVTFQATSVGTSTLHLQDPVATNTSGVSLSPSAEDGEVIVGAAAPNVTSITPNSGHVGQVVDNAIVEGEYFQVDASVQLSRTGRSPILASFVNVESSTRISCTLNLGKAATGQWDVVVTNPNGKSGTLEDGFTIEDACLYLPIVLKNG
ncbi:MAG: hypothetical protein JSV36_19895 [Anaerolineae bacterium]|nr:MAG: hypothetical protein JSV36_19895 [Anaerolineae bacterium]